MVAAPSGPTRRRAAVEHMFEHVGYVGLAEPAERTPVSKVDQQRAMREARWQNRGSRTPAPRIGPARANPTPSPAPTSPTAVTTTVPRAGEPSLERPAVQPGRAIGAYKQPDLVALVEWIMSDGVTRTDSQILELVMTDLGFARQGRTIRSRVSEAITTVLGVSQAAAS